jgi:phospholipid/cholesterol/gamma-HCH transport system substrate-binding protein
MEPQSESPPPAPPPIAHVEFKAVLLLILITALIGGFLLYVMYARGVFESTQQLVLKADDSEGIIVGMDLTFAGFPVGRVRRIELGADGKARIIVDVPRKDAHWLRTSSIFTMERGMVGETHIRAFSGVLSDPPLPENAEREVLRGDTGAEIPRLVASARALLENLEKMTAPDSSINTSLGHLQTVTEKMTGRYGVLGGVLGGDDKAKKIIATLDSANATLDRANTLLAKTDQRVFGANGVMDDAKNVMTGTQAAAAQLTSVLTDVRASLQKVDAVLVEAQAVGANARVASADLGALRAEVEISLRKVGQLVEEINRKWPFARDVEIRLP